MNDQDDFMSQPQSNMAEPSDNHFSLFHLDKVRKLVREGHSLERAEELAKIEPADEGFWARIEERQKRELRWLAKMDREEKRKRRMGYL